MMRFDQMVESYVTHFEGDSILSATVESLFPGRRLQVFVTLRGADHPRADDAPYVLLLMGEQGLGAETSTLVRTINMSVGVLGESQPPRQAGHIDRHDDPGLVLLEGLRVAVLESMARSPVKAVLRHTPTDYLLGLRYPLLEAFCEVTLTEQVCLGRPPQY